MNPEELEERATSLSAGYRATTNGHEAANVYREAARAYQERGSLKDRWRARRCLDLATWCDAQDITPAPAPTQDITAP